MIFYNLNTQEQGGYDEGVGEQIAPKRDHLYAFARISSNLKRPYCGGPVQEGVSVNENSIAFSKAFWFDYGDLTPEEVFMVFGEERDLDSILSSFWGFPEAGFVWEENEKEKEITIIQLCGDLTYGGGEEVSRAVFEVSETADDLILTLVG